MHSAALTLFCRFFTSHEIHGTMMKGTEAIQSWLLDPDKHSKHEKECETEIHFEQTGIWRFGELDTELDGFHNF